MLQLDVWHQLARMHQRVIFICCQVTRLLWGRIRQSLSMCNHRFCVRLANVLWERFREVPLSFCPVVLAHHTLGLLGTFSPLLNTSTSWCTKTGFHKWILTCYILELQRGPLSTECLLLENREWWLLQFLPHSWRGCWTPSHLTAMMACTELWVLAVKKRGFLWRCVLATRVCVCGHFSCAVARKVKLSRGIGGGLWECLVMR